MPRTPPDTSPESTIKILVVEDERIIALNLKDYLESFGYSVVDIVGSGEKAIEKATEYRPDLVLMDIRLQGNMDGIAAAQQIWDHLSIPVIYITGNSDKNTLEQAKLTAPFGYLLKPVKEWDLSIAIEIALQRYEREYLLSSILRGMGDGVIVVDKEHRVKSLNRVAELLTGWQLFEAKEQELAEIFQLIDEQTQQPVDSLVSTVLEQDTTVYLKDGILLISKNGTVMPIGDSIAPIKDNKGAITGAVLVFRDMSDAVAAAAQRKRVEAAIHQQLEQERKLNQLQSQILQSLSHEYRTPLATILACSHILESNTTLLSVEKLRRNCHKIQQAVKYMVRLLEDLSTFNRVESGELMFSPTPLDLQRFCRQLIQEYKLIDSKNHTIKLLSRGKRYVPCLDEKLLQQILGNLLSNALKYSPIKSTITLVMTYETNQIIFQVQDKGIGIPLEDQPHICEPFRRGTNVGTVRGMGMGLAIVEKAVNLHGGTLSFESEAGVGTSVLVTLPGC